jgi:hypothetical protein
MSSFNHTIPGYNFIYKQRTTAQGGGVGLYIKDVYKFKILETHSIFVDRIFESLFIEIRSNNSFSAI